MYTWKRYSTIFLILAALLTMNACSWMGETAGRAKAGMENAVKDTKEGYNKGYGTAKSEEEKKSGKGQ